MALRLVCHKGEVLHSETDTSEILIMPKYMFLDLIFKMVKFISESPALYVH